MNQVKWGALAAFAFAVVLLCRAWIVFRARPDGRVAGALLIVAAGVMLLVGVGLLLYRVHLQDQSASRTLAASRGWVYSASDTHGLEERLDRLNESTWVASDIFIVSETADTQVYLFSYSSRRGKANSRIGKGMLTTSPLRDLPAPVRILPRERNGAALGWVADGEEVQVDDTEFMKLYRVTGTVLDVGVFGMMDAAQGKSPRAGREWVVKVVTAKLRKLLLENTIPLKRDYEVAVDRDSIAVLAPDRKDVAVWDELQTLGKQIRGLLASPSQ